MVRQGIGRANTSASSRHVLPRALAFVMLASFLGGCSVSPREPSATDPPDARVQGETSTPMPPTLAADVISVHVTGKPSAYQFSVEVRSPDEGCDQYADWWEVLTDDGELIYRRLLDHSHVDEQAFERSGGPVAVGADTIVLIRAHMHPGGYGGSVMQGTVRDGFETVETETDFAAGLEGDPPQPTGCAF